MNKLGLAIRQRLSQLGKTQLWLALELGVSGNAVTKWIHTGKISRENAVAAAKVLDISVEELLGVAQHADVASANEASDEMLKRAAEMIEIYRLSSPTDRERIDLVMGEIRARLHARDESKLRAT